MTRFIFMMFILFLFSSCSDNAVIRKSKEDLKKVNCMRLSIFPRDEFLSNTLHKLYKFDKNCSYKLEASEKSGIICNSNQNADKKTFSNFPSGYIRLDLSKDSKIIFSYYRDLTHKADEDDIKKAFQTLEVEINNSN